jgi:cephalosporin hydroxylase
MIYNDPVVAAFHTRYMTSPTWTDTWWQGVRLAKCPMDLWIYQELIYETKPSLIIETGTFLGGSALYFAHLLDLNRSHGEVITVDVETYAQCPPSHSRITYLRGSSTDPAVVAQITGRTPNQRVMVVLDSDHTYEHVMAELECYAGLVTPGCYLVLEDTDTDGPQAALQAFLPDARFVQDRSREKNLMTLYPGGWLRRT